MISAAFKKKMRLESDYAVKRGRIKKPQKCEKCGAENLSLQKHHPDYLRPLWVVWLCEPCHLEELPRKQTMVRENGLIMELKCLPVSIPSDYADVLKVDPSHISHCNAGRRRFTIAQSNKLMEASLIDPRLAGLTFLQLHPELEESRRWLGDAQQEGQSDEQ